MHQAGQWVPKVTGAFRVGVQGHRCQDSEFQDFCMEHVDTSHPSMMMRASLPAADSAQARSAPRTYYFLEAILQQVRLLIELPTLQSTTTHR